MGKVITLISCVIILGVLLIGCNRHAELNEHMYMLGPREQAVLDIPLDSGDVLEGYITIRFGDELLDFTILDQSGEVLITQSELKRRHDFYYAASLSSGYSLLLENQSSENVDKLIYISYKISQ